MTVQLKIRRLQSGESLIAEFESLSDAETWLRERPKFVDVLGTVGGLGESVDKRLRAAMRPFDDDEQGLVAKQDAIAAEAVRRAMEREQAAAEAAMEEHARDLANADPNRPMHVAWDHESGMHNGEDGDSREIPELVREAVLAWIEERNSWVHPRGQFIATANLMVWPGPMPGDEDERVQPGGQFTTLYQA